MKPFENSEPKDWHPGSKNQVLDLVHPSLYCLIYGITRKTTNNIPLDKSIDMIGEGESIKSI